MQSRTMLVLPIHGILITVLWLLVCVTADTSSDASDSSLFDMVPSCARDCVESFIKSEYTPEQCTSPSNVKCLCRTKTPDGLTLGEAALSCVLSVCSREVIADSKAYHICDSVSGAIPKTHKTITATVFSDMSTTMAADATTTADTMTAADAATTAGASKTADVTTTADAAAIPKETTTSSPGTSEQSSNETSEAPLAGSTTSFTSSKPTTTTSSHTSENTSSDATSSGPQAEATSSAKQDPLASSGASEDTNKKGDHSISPGAVIGMSVASGLAGAFIIVVAVIFCCKRWRKKQRDQSDPHHFEIGGAMSEPPDFSKPMPRLPTPSSGPSSLHDQTMEDAPPQRSYGFQPMASGAIVPSSSGYSPHLATISHGHQSKRSREERIGLAASSDSEWEASPYTQSSQHSVARLLPDQSTGLYPKPLKWSHRPASGDTLFEEDETQQTAAMMRNNPPRPGAQPRLAGLPANPRAFIETPTGFKRRSGPRTLASPFNPNPACRTSSSESSNSNSPQKASNYTITRDGHSPSSSGAEMANRPRIIRAEDIKRVQIRSSPRQPEVVAPYCPEDLWQERARDESQESTEPPYPSDIHPGAVHYPDSPKAPNRISPTSRNLTPSRRGEDLILRVD
ncbi:unnamed protein product [Penicillium olsonii]|nr:unnamed protein product [Penicillium olsonii]